MFKFFTHKRQEKIGGLIDYLGLTNWWLETFTKEERNYILDKYSPLGGNSSSLISGEILETDATAISLLSSLSGWFRKPAVRDIAYRMIEKAEEMVDEKSDILDVHFLYQTKIKTYYRYRDVDSNALSKAITACQQQINISPQAKKAFKEEYPNDPLPSHIGFYQLSVIEKKKGNYQKAIEICERALKEGWAGDWQKRIEQYKKKIN